MTLSEANIFTRQLSAGQWLVYMPLAKYATVATSSQVEELKRCLAQGGGGSDDPTVATLLANVGTCTRPVYRTGAGVADLRNMMILPNNVCNFRCTYCYSAEGRSGATLDPAKLRSALAYFLAPERAPGERLTISVLGGGEPLLSWPSLRQGLDLAYRLADERRQKLPVSLVTNGSLVDDEIIAYLRDHDISLSVSFDILPEVQDRQRGHYDLVAANVNRLTAAGIDVAFNTVITAANVFLMDDMLRHAAKAFPGVKKMSFKSLISNTYFTNAEERSSYYRRFVDNFFAALALAKELGIWLTSPYLNNALCVSDSFCPGKFVVTSEGDISICHCVGSRRDRLYDSFIFGTVADDGTVAIDHQKLRAILAHDHNRNDRCRDCIAHWHCAGGCYADNSTIGNDPQAQDAYCESMRYFIERFITEFILPRQ